MATPAHAHGWSSERNSVVIWQLGLTEEVVEPLLQRCGRQSMQARRISILVRRLGASSACGMADERLANGTRSYRTAVGRHLSDAWL